MAQSRVGIRSFAKTAIRVAALGVSTLTLMAPLAAADEAADPSTNDPITVTGERIRPESPRYTAPLIDMPQTITILPAEVIAEQNLLSLRDVLSTLPGITFGAGEGGGGYGDSINLRGYSASNDIAVDGVRDSAQYSRTDPFNLDQLELVSGANSVYGGSGSVGGSINLITKRPSGRDNSAASLALGTDAYSRVTLDANRALGETVGVRLNLMAHQNDVPGRDVENFERWGVAPAIAFGLGTPTRATILYIHQEDENVPQYGVPYALGPFNGGALPGVDSGDYFGYRNIDTQEITVDGATFILEHDFNDSLSIRNLSRWQQVSQLAIVDPPQGTWCVEPGINPWTGAACAAPGTYLPSGPRGTARDTVNEILINQTDLTAEFSTGGLKHTLVAGLVFSNETYHLDNGNVLRNPLGATPNPTLPVMDISDPDNVYTGPVSYIRTSYSDNEVQNAAIYAFDRIEIGDHFEINGGLRFERNEGQGQTFTITVPYPAPPAQPTITPGAPAHNEDDLFSYRVGVVYKPVGSASIYLAYGNSRTPSQSSVNGACAATGAAQNCNLDPEEAEIIELGAKWAVLDDRLLLTAAVFSNERTNFRVASGDPLVPQQQLDGQARVNGLSLGAAGLLTDNWSIFANYTFLDSEIVQNISDIAIGGGAIDFQAGDPLPVTPEHSGSVWTTYQTPIGLMIGYGVTYQGEYTFARQTASTPLFYTPSYWLHRAMVSYEVTDNFVLQLNVNNLFDEDYFERIRNNAGNGWATPGASRSAALTAQFRF